MEATEWTEEQRMDYAARIARKWCVEQGFYRPGDADAVHTWVMAGGLREIEDRKWAFSEAKKHGHTHDAASIIKIAQDICDWVTASAPLQSKQ